jgi:hypothetical protein
MPKEKDTVLTKIIPYVAELEMHAFVNYVIQKAPFVRFQLLNIRMCQ